MKDRIRRSVIKTLSWRIIASLTTLIIVFFLTGSLTYSLGAGLLDFVLKLLVYYIHERVWNGIAWGRR